MAATRVFHQRTEGFRRPQVKEKAILRKGTRGWFLTCELPRAFRLLEMSIIVPIPEELTLSAPAGALVEGSEVPVYVRLYIDASQEDAPGVG